MKKYDTNDCNEARSFSRFPEERGATTVVSNLYAAEFLLYAFHFNEDSGPDNVHRPASNRLTICITSEQ